MNSRPLLTSSFAGLAAPLLAASFVLTALSACSCAPEPEAPPPPAPAPTNVVVEEPEAPPKGYDGPVRGLFMDGSTVPVEFVPERVKWDQARLDLDIGPEEWPDAAIRLAWLKSDRYKVPFGTTFHADPATNDPKEFVLALRWRVPDTRAPKQREIKHGFTVDVTFDPDDGEGPLTGYVDIVCGEPRLDVRGRFTAEFDGIRTEYGIADPTEASDANLSHLFAEKFREQYPGTAFEILRVADVRRHKTADKMLRVGYLEVELNIEDERTMRSALLVQTPEGFACEEILEPWQIPEAFPVFEPQPPPEGNIRSYIEFIVAAWMQNTLSPDTNVFGYKHELVFGPPPFSWCLSTVTYHPELQKKAKVDRQFVSRKTELGWMVEGEILEGFRFDQASGEIVPDDGGGKPGAVKPGQVDPKKQYSADLEKTFEQVKGMSPEERDKYLQSLSAPEREKIQKALGLSPTVKDGSKAKGGR